MAIVPLTNNILKKFIRTIKWFFSRINQYKAVYITEKVRPVRASLFSSYVKDYSDDVAILMQGPIIEDDNFTFETIKLYRRNFPNSFLVLSTWNNQFVHNSFIKDNNIIVVKGLPYQGSKGYGSTNFQIIGNQNGIKRINEIGVKYTLKTRTDQRFYNEDLLLLLKDNIELFPLNNILCTNQNKRLIGMSFDTFLYRLYGLSDMFLFGDSSDVASYLNCNLDNRDFSNYILDNETQRKYSLENICEVYFMTEFLKRKGVIIDWSLEQSWREFAERFIILDSYSLGFFWPKYSYIEDRWRNFKCDEQNLEMTYSKWLRLLNNSYKINESILDLPLKVN
tara:strand:- start:284 stop:1294 length:1011 start_codon:yes stop_codon:yes gene_type:complete